MMKIAAPILAVALAACSGGGGSGSTTPPPPATPALELFAGSPAEVGNVNGIGAAARFGSVGGISTDAVGNVWVPDAAPAVRTVRMITPQGVVSTVAGGAPRNTDGAGANAGFDLPGLAAADRFGNVYVTDAFIFGGGSGVVITSTSIRKVAPAGIVTTLALAGGTLGTVRGLTTDGTGNLYVSHGECAQLPPPSPTSCFGRVQRISPEGAAVTLAATPGAGGTSSIFIPAGLAIDSRGNVFVVDGARATISRIAPNGTIEVFAGTADSRGTADGTGPAARFNGPRGLAIDSADNLYVADSGNHTVRKITPSGVVTTIAGMPGQPGFVPGPLPGLLNTPTSLAIDGTSLYVGMATAIAVVRARP